MAQDKIRTFLAIPFGNFFEKEFIRLIDAFNAYSQDIKFVDPRQIHLTLHFLGSIDAGRVESLSVMLRNLVSRFSAFDLILKGIGAFPNLNNPRVLWAGLDGDLRELMDIKEACDLEIVRIGFPIEDRGFKPHLTLGRVLESSRVHLQIPPSLENYDYKQKYNVRELILYKSGISSQGPVYTPIEKFPLKSAS